MGDKKNSWWMPALALVLAALLPVLAVLQYRWIGAVSDGEQARMQRTLRADVLRFADDFDRSLEQAHQRFLTGAVPTAEALPAHLTRQYRHWRTTTAYPALIKAIYWIDYDTDYAPRLHRLDTTAVALVPSPWSDTLAAWRAFFARTGASSPPTTPERPAPSDPPGLVLPLALPFSPGSSLFADSLRAVRRSHVLLLLDPVYVAETIFPVLAHTYFPGGDEASYDVLIHRRDDPEQVAYRSHPTLTAADFDAPDAAVDLGLSSRTSVTTYVTDDGAETTVLTQDSTATDLERAVVRDAEMILHKVDESEDVTRAPWPDPTRSRPNRAGGVRLDETSGPTTPWRLLVRHRAGSIEAAIASTRRRTLAVSFGILLVLGGAMGLLFVSARRARRLAEQQMAFVAGVTHELRTPLAVIRSAAENLADGVITDPEQARRYGALIHSEGRRLSEIVEQALALAGAQSNHAALAVHPTAVPAVVEQALARCRPTLNEHNVAVTRFVPDGLPLVRADARALEAALCNLITNACKYGGPGGRIELEAEQVVNGHTAEIRITVRDQGPGIPADERPRLFEPFYRGRAARQAQIRGSGLGLSLVKNTIAAHGGRVSVASAPGQGSAFTLHLPVLQL